jgi:dihydrofolate synthase / folylpolyglutamate synthase
MEINSALEKLFSLNLFGIKLGLENINLFLEKLGNPQHNLKSFHIAGSNGKGSTASFITSILKEHGYKVGLYTSPHFVKFNERIRINGVMIDDEYISKYLSDYIDYIDHQQLTFFEVTTALAFKYFYENNVDYAVIETGLGGRLDATNVIHPIASIITSISLEHTQHLGDSLEKIAFEKAGIIKSNIFVFSGIVSNNADRIILNKALELNCKYNTIRDFAEKENDRLIVKLDYKQFSIYSTPLRGEHQLFNAALAVKSLNSSLNLNDSLIFMKGISNVIANTGIEGRYEIANDRPKIILDSAHNPEGIQTFVKEFSKEYSSYNEKYLIFGAMKDKSIAEMLSVLKPFFTKIFITKINYERAASIQELSLIAQQLGVGAQPLDNPEDFLMNFMKTDGNNCLVILGSMYLLGEIKSKKIMK